MSDCGGRKGRERGSKWEVGRGIGRRRVAIRGYPYGSVITVPATVWGQSSGYSIGDKLDGVDVAGERQKIKTLVAGLDF